MAAWKQIVFALVILVAAAAAWVRFFPGAHEVLARWGIEWADAATSAQTTGAVDPARQASGRDSIRRPANVVAQPASTATINDRLQAIGTGRANASVTVNPYSSGRLVEFLVASGTRVDKGQVIATLDSDTEVIAEDRAKVGLQDAQD
ncbi:biotin/lipoyl-binding protein, partial [Mesorhizobium sp. M4B.F.Ca.ET.088.02.2.1]